MQFKNIYFWSSELELIWPVPSNFCLMTPLHQRKEGRDPRHYMNSIRITLVTHHAENTEMLLQ